MEFISFTRFFMAVSLILIYVIQKLVGLAHQASTNLKLKHDDMFAGNMDVRHLAFEDQLQFVDTSYYGAIDELAASNHNINNNNKNLHSSSNSKKYPYQHSQGHHHLHDRIFEGHNNVGGNSAPISVSYLSVSVLLFELNERQGCLGTGNYTVMRTFSAINVGHVVMKVRGFRIGASSSPTIDNSDTQEDAGEKGGGDEEVADVASQPSQKGSPSTDLQNSCHGYGFTIYDCQPFDLPPKHEHRIRIAFTPDFTLTKTIVTLTILTNVSKELRFALVATIPRNLLVACNQSLPRPDWEATMHYLLAVGMMIIIACSVIIAYLEAKLYLNQEPKRRQTHSLTHSPAVTPIAATDIGETLSQTPVTNSGPQRRRAGRRGSERRRRSGTPPAAASATARARATGRKNRDDRGGNRARTHHSTPSSTPDAGNPSMTSFVAADELPCKQPVKHQHSSTSSSGDKLPVNPGTRHDSVKTRADKENKPSVSDSQQQALVKALGSSRNGHRNSSPGSTSVGASSGPQASTNHGRGITSERPSNNRDRSRDSKASRDAPAKQQPSISVRSSKSAKLESGSSSDRPELKSPRSESTAQAPQQQQSTWPAAKTRSSNTATTIRSSPSFGQENVAHVAAIVATPASTANSSSAHKVNNKRAASNDTRQQIQQTTQAAESLPLLESSNAVRAELASDRLEHKSSIHTLGEHIAQHQAQPSVWSSRAWQCATNTAPMAITRSSPASNHANALPDGLLVNSSKYWDNDMVRIYGTEINGAAACSPVNATVLDTELDHLRATSSPWNSISNTPPESDVVSAVSLSSKPASSNITPNASMNNGCGNNTNGTNTAGSNGTVDLFNLFSPDYGPNWIGWVSRQRS